MFITQKNIMRIEKKYNTNIEYDMYSLNIRMENQSFDLVTLYDVRPK